MSTPLGQPTKVTFETFSDELKTTHDDPTTATIYVKAAATGIIVPHVWPSGDLTKDATGKFSWTLPNTTAGLYQWRAVATGAVATSTQTGAVLVDDAFPPMLVGLDDVKMRLNIDPTDISQDVELQDYINSATVTLQNLYGDIIPQSYTETLRPYGDGTHLLAGRSPLLSVDSISVTWPYPSSPTINLSANLYFTNLATGEITVFAFSPAFAWQYAMRDWSTARFLVTYTAGKAGIAANVKDALLDLIQFWWRQAKAAGTQTYGDDAGGGLPAPFGIPNSVAEKLSITPRVIA